MEERRIAEGVRQELMTDGDWVEEGKRMIAGRLLRGDG